MLSHLKQRILLENIFQPHFSLARNFIGLLAQTWQCFQFGSFSDFCQFFENDHFSFFHHLATLKEGVMSDFLFLSLVLISTIGCFACFCKNFWQISWKNPFIQYKLVGDLAFLKIDFAVASFCERPRFLAQCKYHFFAI